MSSFENTSNPTTDQNIITYQTCGVNDVVGNSDSAINSETETLLLLLGNSLLGDSLDSHSNRLLALDRLRRASETVQTVPKNFIFYEALNTLRCCLSGI